VGGASGSITFPPVFFARRPDSAVGLLRRSCEITFAQMVPDRKQARRLQSRRSTWGRSQRDFRVRCPEYPLDNQRCLPSPTPFRAPGCGPPGSPLKVRSRQNQAFHRLEIDSESWRRFVDSVCATIRPACPGQSSPAVQRSILLCLDFSRGWYPHGAKVSEHRRIGDVLARYRLPGRGLGKPPFV